MLFILTAGVLCDQYGMAQLALLSLHQVADFFNSVLCNTATKFG